MGAFAGFANGGREPVKKRIKEADLLQWPDTPWRFTSHAILRMGERKVRPADVLRVLSYQDVRRPGHLDGEEIWTRDDVKVVVNPDRQIVKTVAKLNQDLDLATAV
jgi:hypothetical protein